MIACDTSLKGAKIELSSFAGRKEKIVLFPFPSFQIIAQDILQRRRQRNDLLSAVFDVAQKYCHIVKIEIRNLETDNRACPVACGNQIVDRRPRTPFRPSDRSRFLQKPFQFRVRIWLLDLFVFLHQLCFYWLHILSFSAEFEEDAQTANSSVERRDLLPCLQFVKQEIIEKLLRHFINPLDRKFCVEILQILHIIADCRRAQVLQSAMLEERCFRFFEGCSLNFVDVQNPCSFHQKMPP